MSFDTQDKGSPSLGPPTSGWCKLCRSCAHTQWWQAPSDTPGTQSNLLPPVNSPELQLWRLQRPLPPTDLSLPLFNFPASGPGVRGAEPPKRCLPLSSSPRPRPQRDTQYSPEAEAVPRGSCQWKPGYRLAAAGGFSGACGRRRGGWRWEPAGGVKGDKEPRGAGGWNAVVQVTRGILRRKRIAHARAWSLKPIARRALTDPGVGEAVLSRLPVPVLLAPVELGASRGGERAGCRLWATYLLFKPVQG